MPNFQVHARYLFHIRLRTILLKSAASFSIRYPNVPCYFFCVNDTEIKQTARRIIWQGNNDCTLVLYLKRLFRILWQKKSWKSTSSTVVTKLGRTCNPFSIPFFSLISRDMIPLHTTLNSWDDDSLPSWSDWPCRSNHNTRDLSHLHAMCIKFASYQS